MFTFRVAPVMLCLLAFSYAGNAQTTPTGSAVDPEFALVFCLSVDASERTAASATATDAKLREFGVSATDWRQIFTSCSRALNEMSALANEARSLEKAAGGRLAPTVIDSLRKRRVALLKDQLSFLGTRLSASGVTAVQQYIAALVQNTSTVRIGNAR